MSEPETASSADRPPGLCTSAQDEPGESPDEDSSGGRGAVLRFVLLAAFLVGAVALWTLTDLERYSSYEAVEGLLHEAGMWAPAAFVGVFAALLVCAVPGTVMAVLGATLFETAESYIYILSAAMLGSCVSFGLGRWLGRDFIEWILDRVPDRICERLERLDERCEEHGFVAIAYLRLAYVPLPILNYTASLTRVRFRDFFWGSLLGFVPGVFVFVTLGGALRSVWEAGDWSGLWTWQTPVAALLVVASLVFLRCSGGADAD
jgi:uncharacterized membrane protein YdjX (TVP38/TMEM64 family)